MISVKDMAKAAVVTAMVLMALGSAKAGWQVLTVDSGSIYENISLKLDQDGKPRLSYYERDFANSPGRLKYSAWNGSAWDIQVVDSSQYAGSNSNSLALDRNGAPAIAYRSGLGGLGTAELRYASLRNGSWDLQSVDHSESSVGAFASLALDAQGNPRISYTGDYRVKYASWNGNSWDIQSVGSSDNLGMSSLSLDSSGVPHIAYTGHSTLNFSSLLGGAWVTQDVGNAQASSASLAISPSGRIGVSYDSSPYLVQYAEYDGVSWTVRTVESLANSGGGMYTSLAFDPDGNPRIAYYSWHPDYETRYAVWNGADWDIEAIPHAEYPSLVVDASGNSWIAYYDSQADALRIATVPEPATLALLALGGLLALRRRR